MIPTIPQSIRRICPALKRVAALVYVIPFVGASAAFADCNSFSTEFSAFKTLANLACDVAPDGDGWVTESCIIWDDINESNIPTGSVDLWNILSDNGPSTIGPRVLDPSIQAHGTLVEPGHRVFLLSAVADNEIVIDVDYHRGKAGLELDVCTINPVGNMERIATFTDDRGNQQGLNETVTVDSGLLIAFKLKPRGGLLREYEYDIEVTLNNIPPSGPVTSLEENIDRMGGDYLNFQPKALGGRRECRRACAGDSQCRAWTFVKPTITAKGAPLSDSRCYLKSSVPSPVSDTCCDSGVKN